MSKLINVLRIEPTRLNLENNAEVVKVIAECPTCNGSGGFRGTKGYHGSAADEEEIITCDRCKGTGQLIADVVIRWKPNDQG